MVSLKSSFLLSIVASVSVAKQIADGSSYQHGSINGLTYESSGWLSTGCGDAANDIEDCYTMHLAAKGQVAGTNDGRTGRQRCELHTPYSREGESKTYSWKFKFDSESDTSDGWMHNMQIKGESDNGDTVTQPTAVFDCTKGRCFLRATIGDEKSDSVPFDSIKGKVLQGRVEIKYSKGNDGSIDISLSLSDDPSNSLLSLSYSGATMYDNSDKSCFKTGLYRKYDEDLGLKDIIAYVGDIVY